MPQTAADLLYLETVAEECAAADGGLGGRARGRCSTGWCRASPTAPIRATCPRASGSPWCSSVVLVGSPPLLLLDEPTRGLDYPAKAGLAEVLRALAADGHAVLVATHDVEFAAVAADARGRAGRGRGRLRPVRPRQVLAESPAFAPQVTKILGPGWLHVDRGAR